jgi:hypothetical protein
MAGSFVVQEKRDPQTQVVYLSITHAAADVWHPYFHIESWSAGDAGFIFHAVKELWYFDLASRQSRSLTAQAGVTLGAPHVSRDGQRLFFLQKQQACGMPLLTAGPVSTLFDVDPLWTPHEISPNGDDSGMAFTAGFNGLYKRISYVDLQSKSVTPCFEGHNLIGHLQMNPALRDRIMYADQHDPANWQRIYTVKANGREHFPFYHQRPGEWVTHECFSRNGRWVTFTVAQPNKGLHIIQSDGSSHREVAAGNYWHACPSADASMIVADLYDGEIRLVQRDTGRYRTLSAGWMPNGRMIPQGLLHAHPNLSRTGKWVLHVDGSSGRAGLRLIDVSRMSL